MKQMKFVKVIKVLSGVLQIAVILPAIMIIVMYFLGYRFYIVKTGSMAPTIPAGSVCIVDLNYPYDKIKVGDIISYRIGENMLVTHRVKDITEKEIVTKGDANNTEDQSLVTYDTYQGKTIVWFPKVGVVIEYFKTKKGKIYAGIIIAIIVLFPAMFKEKPEH